MSELKKSRMGHTIKAVARKTGLSTHVIRAWEKRYGAVQPSRSQSNRRLYGDHDIKRLILLHRATLAGESIGQIANLPDEELASLAETPPSRRLSGYGEDAHSVETRTELPSVYVEKCLKAATELDAETLEKTLLEAAVNISQPVFLEQVMEPLMERVGEMWRDGLFKVVHEHLVSAIVRTILGGMFNTHNIPANAPVIIVGTPDGHLHEFGALLAALTAAADGWRVIYLGPNIPSDDLANAVKRRQASVVALSLVYPSDDSSLARELVSLRKYLGNDIIIIVGGRAAKYYRRILDDISGIYVSGLEDFRDQLSKIRLGKNNSQ
jgi:DNA-binding transcriptional MerR regulator/methylmalonyl-CoA mutase cobalamin-binding subunit